MSACTLVCVRLQGGGAMADGERTKSYLQCTTSQTTASSAKKQQQRRAADTGKSSTVCERWLRLPLPRLCKPPDYMADLKNSYSFISSDEERQRQTPQRGPQPARVTGTRVRCAVCGWSTGDLPMRAQGISTVPPPGPTYLPFRTTYVYYFENIISSCCL